MNKSKSKTLAIAGMAMLGAAALVVAQEEAGKPAEVKPAPQVVPKLKPAEFLSQIGRDSAEVRNAGQVTLSYADVVERTLPTVVSIGTYTTKSLAGGGRMGPNMDEDDIEQLPPMFREFFKDWLERHGEEGGTPAPRGNNRRAPRAPQGPRQTGLGSGVLLTSDGYIMTNNHVVENADQLKVRIGGQNKEYIAKVIGSDPSTDIALIKIDGKDLPKATFGDSAKLRVGDVVLAIGSPMGLDQSVTQGIISALGRSDVGIIRHKQQSGYEDFIQTDAAINPGNSGGPLVDGLGRVIGINTAIETRSGMFSGIGLAIPSNMALSIVTDLLDDGKVDRGFLGVVMSDVDPSMADFYGLNDSRGVTVSEVVPDSPAEKAGLLGGDVIVSADGEKVEQPSKLRLMISGKHPGEAVKFGVIRFNEKTKKPENLSLTATLEKLDADKFANVGQRPGDKGGSADKSGSFLTGVKIENLTSELRDEYSLDEKVEGVLVTSVKDDSPAAKVGLQQGDVIVQVNRQNVKSTAEARSHRGDEDGAPVVLKILRDGQTKHIVIRS
ncbi:serine protease Do [Roseimicrobium gellanilyticum]|uniref:Serine protease Do n=1 Tax=Roseimicrobium gellanilyticum TaxID=748857 RepID=A0A366HPY8_9BACT|nr:Do family serine endopeptidase [Roseimicrobium gellanilyticum]RBP45711.1 serine protease Do [Roseimicrobium gellanilyticum]